MTEGDYQKSGFCACKLICFNFNPLFITESIASFFLKIPLYYMY